jgi:YesN/AraC family two-component response regulator
MIPKYTVLILDDENVIAEILEKKITELYDGHTFRVINASDGLKALQIISEPGEKIDILITDIMHPEISGVELIQRIRENFPQIKIIVQTGFGDKEILDLCNIFADTVLKKPFKMIDLTKAIMRLLPASNRSY